jgi:RimJ/RimL family protein N-acetyltransferase
MLNVTTLREPSLRTARLTLRTVVPADLDALAAGLNDPGVARMLSRVPYPYGRSDAEAFLALVRSRPMRDLSLVIDRDGEVIGGIGLNDISGVREFGYWLNRAAWGNGYATEAGAAFLAHCFAAYACPDIRSGVFVDNPASLRVQDKLGFERLGMSRRPSLARGGDVDHIDTILTRRRFREFAP